MSNPKVPRQVGPSVKPLRQVGVLVPTRGGETLEGTVRRPSFSGARPIGGSVSAMCGSALGMEVSQRLVPAFNFAAVSTGGTFGG